MSKRILAASAVFLLVVAACGGDDDNASRTTAQSSPSPGASATPAGTAATDAATPAAARATAAAATSAPRTSTQASSPPTRPAPAGSVNSPKAGRYTYSVTGEATDQFTGQKEKLPNDTRAYVDLTVNGSEFTAKQTSNQEQGSMTSKFRRETSRVLLLQVKVSQPPVLNVQCDFNPGVEVLHIPIKAESFPSQTRKDGSDCSQTTQITVSGQENVNAAGKTWKTWKIVQKTSYNFNNGAITGTIDGVIWFAPDLGQEVKNDTTNKGVFKSGATQQRFESHTVATLLQHP